MYGVPAVPLRLDDVPELAVRAGEEPDVGGLPPALGEDDGVVEDDLEQRCGRGGCRSLLLLALAPVGRGRGRLGDAAAHGGGRKFAKQRITCKKAGAAIERERALALGNQKEHGTDAGRRGAPRGWAAAGRLG